MIHKKMLDAASRCEEGNGSMLASVYLSRLAPSNITVSVVHNDRSYYRVLRRSGSIDAAIAEICDEILERTDELDPVTMLGAA